MIVLLGLMLCQGQSTLSGMVAQVADRVSVSGLSRFLSEAPWSASELAQQWQQRFAQQTAPLVQQEHARQRAKRGKRRGRPKRTRVTGYLIGDDSTMAKPKGQKMAGLGWHHSSTEGKRVRGHSLVQGLHVLLDGTARCCRACTANRRFVRQRACLSGARST